MNHELPHIRQRKDGAVEEKGNNVALKTFLDKVSYPIALFGPLSSLDQVIQIWKAQSAEGVSIIVWFVFLFTSVFWIFYAVIHRTGAIFFSHVLWIILSSIILFEIIIFS